MKPLNDAVVDKIHRLKINNQAYVELFAAIAADAEMRNLPSATCIATIYDDGDLSPGDWAPELHFVVRKVAEPEPEQDGND